MPALILALLLTACAAPQTRDITVIVAGNREPLVLVDGDRCAIVLPREVGYAELGAAVRTCFRRTLRGNKNE